MRFHTISKCNASRCRRRERRQLETGWGQRVRRVLLKGEFTEIRQARRGTRGDDVIGPRGLWQRRRIILRHRGATPAPATDRGPTPGRVRPVAAAGESLLNGEIKCEQQYDGKTVSVLSPVRNSENEPDAVETFTDFWKPFVDCTGRQDRLPGHRPVRDPGPGADPGRQPARRDRLPAAGSVAHAGASATSSRSPTNVAEHADNDDFIAGWEGLDTVDGEVYGHPVARQRQVDGVVQPGGLRGRSGYEIPETLDELKALSDQIVADGGTPWCAGIESGVATGWPITDWFEDFMLRLNGPEVYDQWVNHEIPFNDPPRSRPSPTRSART